MEYEIFGIPRPNLTLFLSLPIDLVQELMFRRRKTDAPRKYLGIKKDVHETNIEHLINARKSALKLEKEVKNFKKIECSKSNKILSREDIHNLIYDEVKKIIKVK